VRNTLSRILCDIIPLMSDIESFKEKLLTLITKFEKDKTHYLSKGYPEAQVRIDFLNPFFKALGWDIENKAQKPPHERDVIVELSPEATGRPDYNFRINGATKFFIEAKAPSIALDDVNHILQAKSYAWSTKEVYFVILTDFEEFKLFDASLKPNPQFPNEGLIFDFKYTDYPDNIEKLWELSKERVEQGSLEALLPKDTRSKRLRIPPDKSFLEDLTIWRTELAKDIHKRNPDFEVKLLNDVVQKLLDRIIFIRIAEDRKIRPDRELWEIVAQWKEEGKRKSIMTHLTDLFHEVNDDLNGDIFKPHACETADVDSNLLADIIEKLYFPESRYRFDAIGVELLGSIYERYLGSTIRVTPQRIKVEEKPEVRKAGGVYYTPKYIVDYIVKNTVGKIIEGKTPRQIANIKILDPACGSGSFLLGAYQCLIDYHLRYYLEHPKEAQTLSLFPYWKMSPDDFTLPIHEKAKILRNNIFGVDIDPQAVEITMMSLYLKALEGERGLLPKKQHLLPPLGNNIKCGNSLIGYDILDGKLFDDDTKSRINPFDWNSKTVGFGEIMANGGFDVVIGNPPWGADFSEAELEYLRVHNEPIIVRMIDSFMYLVFQTSQRISPKGSFGMILPDVILYQKDNYKLRHYILNKFDLKTVINLGNDVFEGVNRPACILLFDNSKGRNNTTSIADFSKMKGKDLEINSSSNYMKIGQKSFLKIPSAMLITKAVEKYKLFDRIIEKLPVEPLENFIDTDGIQRGVSPDLKEAFIVDQATINKFDLELSKLKPTVTGGKQVKRYYINYHGHHLIYTKRTDNFKTIPRICDYIDQFKNKITCKEVAQRKHPLYALHRSRDENIFLKSNKLIGVITDDELIVALDKGNLYPTDGCYLFSLAAQEKTKYILALLNSKLFVFIYRLMSLEEGRALAQVKPTVINKLPIRTLDFNNPAGKTVHDKLDSLVDRMIELNKKKSALPPSAERDKIEREIAITDEKIDDIVYGLYGITEEERKIIELG
jgi:type I restriction-modification system DNA methylase subunit